MLYSKRITAVAACILIILYIGNISKNVYPYVVAELHSFVSLTEKIENIKEAVTYTIDQMPFMKRKLLEVNGFTNKLLDKNKNDNQIYKMTNGYLTQLINYYPNTSFFADKTAELYAYLNQKNIDFLYVQAPHKNNKFEVLLPEGVECYVNQNMDEFLDSMKNEGVPYLDLRQLMYDEKISPYDQFFISDHHWKPEAGLWASNKIMNYLITQYHYKDNSNLLNKENYTTEIYPNIFLGSHGKNTTKTYTQLDDISLIYPNFYTELEYSIPSTGLNKEGNFEEALFDRTKLSGDMYQTNTYYVYTGGDFELNIIQNKLEEKSGTGKKVLLIKDSFAEVVSPYLSLCFEELHIFDIRINYEYTVYEYIEEIKPDLVLVLYHGGVISGGNEFMFEFDKIRSDE